jgi:hypothetical protein
MPTVDPTVNTWAEKKAAMWVQNLALKLAALTAAVTVVLMGRWEVALRAALMAGQKESGMVGMLEVTMVIVMADVLAVYLAAD